MCYQTVVTATGRAQAGVCLVMRKRPELWIVKSMRFHGPNMVIYEIVSGAHQTFIIKKYLPSSTIDHLPDLEEALNRFPGREPIVMGDLDADIGILQNPQN